MVARPGKSRRSARERIELIGGEDSVKHKSVAAAMLLVVASALSVWGDPTALSISDGSVTIVGSTSNTLNFPISRTGDTSYDAFIQYQTQDGTAVGGVDYAGGSGSVVIPAGATSATIPVAVFGNGSVPPDKAFQVQLIGGGGGSFAPSFATKQAFSAGLSPSSVKAADLNGDGKLDLIVTDSAGSAVSVLLNTTAPGATTPSFATQQTFATGSKETSVTVADINGDGKPDLIVTNEGNGSVGSGTVSVLLNTTAPGATTASFATQQVFATDAAPLSVTAADLNGDGRPDLIVSNGGSDETVSVLFNTTTPGSTTASFAPEQAFAVGEVASSVIAADLNGDGRPDLIVANRVDNTISVLLNTTAPGATTPSFTTQQVFSTGDIPATVTAADVNGDGLPDIIFSNVNDNTVWVLLNTTTPGAGIATFADPQSFATGTQPSSVTAADVNRDGRPDLVVTNTGDNTVSVLLNGTAPGASVASFTTQRTFSVGRQPFAVTAADLNGDGKLDVITANDADRTVTVLLNTTPAPTTTFDSGSYASHHDFATGSFTNSVATADVNGDGRPDLITANVLGTVSVLLNTTAPGAAAPGFATQHSFAAGSNPTSVTAADINGDGLPDLIVANNAGSNVSVLLNTTAPGAITPSFATQQTFATGSSPFSVTAADINGDGEPDLIVANNADNTVSVLLNTTAPGATTPSFATQQTFATGSSPFSVTAADINGDGEPDLIVANNGGNTVSVLLNTTAPGATTPSFATQQTFSVGENANAFAVTAADVNGDGLPDLIVTNTSGNTVSVLLNTTAPGAATPSFATQQAFATGNQPRSVRTADVNGDGLPDLIVANSADDTVSVLLNTTAPGATVPSFSTQQTFATGSFPASVTTADVNGDGKLDLITANLNDGSVSVLLNNLYATSVSGSSATGSIHYTPPPPPPTHIVVATSLLMGSYPVGNTIIKNLTVKNSGTNPLFIGSVTSNDLEFATTGATTCPMGGLAPAATCTIAIEFTPNSLGLHSATLSVSDNTSTSPQHVLLSGTGTATLTLSPTSWGFSSVKDGLKATKAIVVHNFQHQQVSLNEGFSGANAGDFSVTGGTCMPTLAATTACTVIVSFAPTAVGTESATMTVTDSPDSLGPYTVSFTAAATIPESLSSPRVVFGNVVQTNSKTLTATVNNKAASGSITLTGTNITGANSSDFAVTGGGTCGGSLAASSSCTYTVSFTPSTETAESASLSIGVAEDPNGGLTVALSGTGLTPLRAAPTPLAFGTVAGGHSSVNKTVTVINSGSAALTISESVTGANMNDFVVTGGSCGAMLAGGGTSCTYTLKFTPSIVGSEGATLAVSAVGDAASPHNVALTGTGS